MGLKIWLHDAPKPASEVYPQFMQSIHVCYLLAYL